MFRRLRKIIGRFLVKNAEDLVGGPFHRYEKAAEKSSKDRLRFAADAERARLDDGRQLPPGIVQPQQRLTPAEERRRVNDRPIP